MTDTAQAALYAALKTRLRSDSEPWGQKAFADLAKAEATKPYVVYALGGGGELNDVVREDGEFVVLVKCVAETQLAAFAGAARIKTLLNDADRSKAGALDGGTDWYILTSTQERVIHAVETESGRQYYHSGAYYRFRMEAK